MNVSAFSQTLKYREIPPAQTVPTPEERNDGNMPEASGPEMLRQPTRSNRGVPPLRYGCV